MMNKYQLPSVFLQISWYESLLEVDGSEEYPPGNFTGNCHFWIFRETSNSGVASFLGTKFVEL